MILVAFASLGVLLGTGGYYFQNQKTHDIWFHALNGIITGAFVGGLVLLARMLWNRRTKKRTPSASEI